MGHAWGLWVPLISWTVVRGQVLLEPPTHLLDKLEIMVAAFHKHVVKSRKQFTDACHIAHAREVPARQAD